MKNSDDCARAAGCGGKILSLILFLLSACDLTGWCASRETVQLQTRLELLQKQANQLDKSTGSSLTQLEEVIDTKQKAVEEIAGKLSEIRNALNRRDAADTARLERVRSTIEAATLSVHQAITQLDEVGKKAGSGQGAASQAAASNALPKPLASAPTKAASQAPVVPSEAVAMYASAMQHYAEREFDTASDELDRFLKKYPQGPNAAGAHFYLGEMEFAEQDFEGAFEDYSAVLSSAPDESKAAGAYYKRAMALLEMEQEEAAVADLRTLISRYPHSAEAGLALRKLKRMGRSH